MPTPQELNIPDKLDSILATKQAIRESIVAKGVEVPEGTTFRQYADFIAGISAGVDTTLSSGEVTPVQGGKFPDFTFTVPVENTQALFVCVCNASDTFSAFVLSLPDGGYYNSAGYGALTINISRGQTSATVSGTANSLITHKYYYVPISYEN